MAVNDHFDITAPDGHAAEKVVDVLKIAWDVSMKRSREIVAKVTKGQRSLSPAPNGNN